MRYALALALALWPTVSPSAARAQAISGNLVEAESRLPLPGAAVTLLTADSAAVMQATTNASGAFSFALPRGRSYRLRAEQEGFQTAASGVLSVGPMDALHVEFSLSRDQVLEDPATVTSETRRLTVGARRFYERIGARPFGTFITRREIEQRQPHRTTELFSRVPGVRVTPATRSGNRVMVRETCRPSVFVDGVRVDEYRSIDDLANPLDLEGIEVYRSPQHAPPEFTGVQAGCAVILIWKRIT